MNKNNVISPHKTYGNWNKKLPTFVHHYWRPNCFWPPQVSDRKLATNFLGTAWKFWATIKKIQLWDQWTLLINWLTLFQQFSKKNWTTQTFCGRQILVAMVKNQNFSITQSSNLKSMENFGHPMFLVIVPKNSKNDWIFLAIEKN